MTKSKTVFICQVCGYQSPRWVGKCPGCGSWNTCVEENVVPITREPRSGVVLDERPALLKDIQGLDQPRISVGIKELDRVLGGGVVPGSVILIGGDPGIGKSTLTLQAIANLSAQKRTVLYVSGEESAQQTKLRADRLGGKGVEQDHLFIVNQVDVLSIQSHIQHMRPDVVVIDSIQVVYHPDISSSPGSVSQVRECAALLTQLAKSLGVALFIIGHVTKDGMIAGPRVLEHIVDTVLYFEGERYTSYRIIRSMKNRFGSTNELGVFEMTSNGLIEVENPSELFLSERPQAAPGSVVVPVLEGSRPFLVEIQGLVSRSNFGVVRQKAHGFDPNRLALLTAVLEKRLDLNLADKDIFLNVVGGVKVMDPAADLGVMIAVSSALLDKVVPFDMVFLGEVGLSSEVRSVSQIAVRLKEAEKLGFKRCVIPKNNISKRADLKTDMQITAVTNVREAIDAI
jgi:DNA repair protein RadA/Sms